MIPPQETSTSPFNMPRFLRLTFWPTLAYNVALERLAFRKWYSRIDETIILGALPWRTLVPEVSNC